MTRQEFLDRLKALVREDITANEQDCEDDDDRVSCAQWRVDNENAVTVGAIMAVMQDMGFDLIGAAAKLVVAAVSKESFEEGVPMNGHLRQDKFDEVTLFGWST